jgi:small ligand-binding sensory domain FIST
VLVAGSSIAQLDCPEAAGRAAAEAAASALGGEPATAALVFASPSYDGDLSRLLAVVTDTLGTECVVGGTAAGLLAAGEDAEDEPAVAILAFAGLEAVPFLLTELRGREASAGATIADRLGGRPGPTDLVVLIPDATAISARPLLHGLQGALHPAALVGATSARGAATASRQWLGSRVETGGLAGLLIRGSREPQIGVTQAARPVTPTLTVTRAAGHWIQSIDGRPALDVYREVARGPLACDLRRAASFLLVAIPAAGDDALARDCYRTRRIVGFSEERGAFALPEAVGRGQELALVLRDPDQAREALGRMLAKFDGAEAPGAALYFSCTGRGRALFGVSGLEAGYVERALPGRAWAGMQGPGQIAPLGSRAEHLTHAGVLAWVG